MLQNLRQRHGRVRIFLAAEQAGEIAGLAALKKFTSELWQIAE
jgi:hypothetical protein